MRDLLHRSSCPVVSRRGPLQMPACISPLTNRNSSAESCPDLLAYWYRTPVPYSRLFQPYSRLFQLDLSKPSANSISTVVSVVQKVVFGLIVCIDRSSTVETGEALKAGCG